MSLPRELEKISVVYSSLFSETFSCVSSPVQFSAIKAYEYTKNLKEYVASSASILDGISTYIFNELSRCNIQCDPKMKWYKVMGIQTSWVGFAKGAANIAQAREATKKGLMRIDPEGPTNRIPADFLIGADGIVETAYYGSDISDHIPFETIENWINIKRPTENI